MRAGIGTALAIAALVVGVLIVLSVIPASAVIVGGALILLAGAVLA